MAGNEIRAGVADEVTKAGFRQKPGPKQGSIQKRFPKKSKRCKANHSEWNSQENRAENPTSAMPPPRKLKKDEGDNLPTAMEL
jgi:hypothetical protein